MERGQKVVVSIAVELIMRPSVLRGKEKEIKVKAVREIKAKEKGIGSVKGNGAGIIHLHRSSLGARPISLVRDMARARARICSV